jgi:parvulin-like peptidyl-prolyl isomerase
MPRVFRNVFIASLAFALAAALAGCGGGDEAKSPDDVPPDAIALVGEEPVPKAELDDLMKEAEQGYKAQKRPFPKAGTPDYENLRSQAIAYLVQRSQYEQEASEMGIEVTDEEVDKKLREVINEVAEGSRNRFVAQLKQQGLTEEQVKENLRMQLLQKEIVDSITKDVEVTDEDVEKFYNENKSQFTQPASRVVRQILIACKKAAECERDKARADDVYRQVTAGGNFASLAKRFSEDAGSKAQGGRYQAVKGQSVPEFDKVAFELDKGEVSRPVKTQHGWHVIQATADVKPERVTPLATVKETVKAQLAQEKESKAVTKWLEDVKKKWEPEIVYAVGYAPPKTDEEGTTATTGE